MTGRGGGGRGGEKNWKPSVNKFAEKHQFPKNGTGGEARKQEIKKKKRKRSERAQLRRRKTRQGRDLAKKKKL